MAIVSFSFEDRDEGWKLEETHFNSLNLLVGISGVGKTRIISALQRIRDAQAFETPSNCSWHLVLNNGFSWSATTSKRDKTIQNTDQGAPYLFERIVYQGQTIVDRKQDSFLFETTNLPKMNMRETALALLDEEILEPLKSAVVSFVFIGSKTELSRLTKKFLNKLLEVHQDSTQDINTEPWTPLLFRLYLLHHHDHILFSEIKATFTDIFPSIEDLNFVYRTELEKDRNDYPDDECLLVMKEQGVGWIPHDRWSDGMLKTLIMISEIILSPKDTILISDELENSLGVNCLPEISELILKHSKDKQFILTSHHPYLINNIPAKHWKIVTRKGRNVRVLNSSDIPALNTASSQKQFVLLMNAPEYEEGVQ